MKLDDYFKVRSEGKEGFIVTIHNENNPVHVKDFAELMMALEHYACPTKEMKVHPKKYAPENKECPICRATRSQE